MQGISEGSVQNPGNDCEQFCQPSDDDGDDDLVLRHVPKLRRRRQRDVPQSGLKNVEKKGL
jgi:hypothetical protein